MEQIASIRLRNSNKKAHIFAITVPYTSISKSHAFESLQEFCSQLVITEEAHANGQLHHHLFLRTYEKFGRYEIKLMISVVYNVTSHIDLDNCHLGDVDSDSSENDADIYVATVRNITNYLAYITKDDDEPLYKGRDIEKNFSFYYKTIKWAKSVEEFDVTHPYVLTHPQYYKLLNEVVLKTLEKKNKSRSLNPLKPIYKCSNEIPNWQEKVIEWWNDWTVNGYSHKKKQLYLWGPSNTGKTTFIMNLLKTAINQPNDKEETFELHIYRPTPNEPKYAWQEFNPHKFNVWLIDEFDPTEYKTSDMKKALAGEIFTINSKNANAKSIKLQIPGILISNFEPPSDQTSENYRGMRERLLIIKATERLF